MRKWKQEDNIALRKLLNELVPSAIRSILGHGTSHRVLSSSITHSVLEPEGASFTITFAVQVNEKKEEPADDGISE